MSEGSGALLEVWGTPLGPFSESFEFKKKTELVQISILVNRFLDKIKIRNSIHKKEGGHYKEEVDHS
jgi:hypothetical protein